MGVKRALKRVQKNPVPTSGAPRPPDDPRCQLVYSRQDLCIWEAWFNEQVRYYVKWIRGQGWQVSIHVVSLELHTCSGWAHSYARAVALLGNRLDDIMGVCQVLLKEEL